MTLKNINLTTVPAMFMDICRHYNTGKQAYYFKTDEKSVSINYSELYNRTEAFAIGLLDLGIRKGDRIGIVSENRIEWIIASFAISAIGACDVPVFPSLTAKQEEFVFRDCETTAIIVSNNFQLSKVLQFKENLPGLRHVIVMQSITEHSDLSVKSMESVMKRGSERLNDDELHTIFERACGNVSPDDLVTLIYTSGTTGNPKGVMLTHKNICSNVEGILQMIDITPDDVFLSFLPLCHAYERTTGFYSAFAGGSTIHLAETIESIAALIPEVRPTLLTTVPKLLETIRKKIINQIEKEKPHKRKIFYWATNIGKKKLHNTQNGKNSIIINGMNKIADKLVFSKIKEKTGGRLRAFVSGGGALPAEICEFFLAAGITVLEGYGLTEASPVVTANRLDDIEIGSVGTPIFNVEVELADDGEILVRGPNVMKGYWNNEAETKEAISPDGWLHTGDIGLFTERGKLKITDRKKHIFVSSGGKNIAPLHIENLMRQSMLIDQCFLIGDNRQYCTALIVPEFEQLKNLASKISLQDMEIADLVTHELILQNMQKDIDDLQKDLAKYERIRRFRILPKPFTIESGELSPKLSLRRHIIEQNYSSIIESMYQVKK